MSKPETKKSSSRVLDEPLIDVNIKTTAEIPVPTRLIDQVLGQKRAVDLINKAAIQRRNVLLIGDPGTGKSMLGAAMAELLPREDLEDILCVPNRKDPNTPKIVTVGSSEGRRIIDRYQEKSAKGQNMRMIISLVIPLAIMLYVILVPVSNPDQRPTLVLGGIFVSFFAFLIMGQMRSRSENLVPKLLVDTSQQTHAPFNDATGAHAGSLLGDVRHDPFQSGGLGTPAHERVESGLIHKVKGLIIEKQSIRTDNTTITKNVCSLHDFNQLEQYETAVTLKEGAEETFLAHYPVFNRYIPEKNALPLYLFTYISTYIDIRSKEINGEPISTDAQNNNSHWVKSQKQLKSLNSERPMAKSGGKYPLPTEVISTKLSHPIAEEEGNVPNAKKGEIMAPSRPMAEEESGKLAPKWGSVLPIEGMPKNAQMQVMKYLKEYKKNKFSMTEIVDAEDFTYRFVQTYEHLKSKATVIKSVVEQLNENGWSSYEIDQRDVAKLIKDTIQDLQVDGVTEIEAVKKHILDNGITLERFDSVIKHMKSDGVVFEPVAGHYKLT